MGPSKSCKRGLTWSDPFSNINKSYVAQGQHYNSGKQRFAGTSKDSFSPIFLFPVLEEVTRKFLKITTESVSIFFKDNYRPNICHFRALPFGLSIEAEL